MSGIAVWLVLATIVAGLHGLVSAWARLTGMLAAAGRDPPLPADAPPQSRTP
jgi:hypothetical protein